jgi:hypothetical protein
MKKLLFLVLIIAAAVVGLMGFGPSIDPTLPDSATAFPYVKFVNPDDPSDVCRRIDYAGRTYLPYGELCAAVSGKDTAGVIGYLVYDDAPENTASRVIALKDTADYLMIFYDTHNQRQPTFFRAADTRNMRSEKPEFIGSLHYAYWGQEDQTP